MEGPPRPPRRVPRRSIRTFQPRFTLLLLYFFAFFVFFCLLLALPALLEGLRSLPPGNGPLTEEEKALAADIARRALEGRLVYALIATTVALGIGLWTRALPGLRRRRP
jgi:hypothetical protein